MPGTLVTRHRVMASIGLPYPPYLQRIILRSGGVWLLVRCAYVVVLMVGVLAFDLLPPPEGVARALHPLLSTRVILVGLTTFLVWWDRRRSHEVLLHANLGTSPVWFWGGSLLTGSVLDVVVQSLLRVL